MASNVLIVCAECGTQFVWLPHEEGGSGRPALCSGCRRVAPAPGRVRGLVKWFSRSKGFGFITPVEGPELFVHKSGMAPGQPLLRPGQLVEFTTAHRSRRRAGRGGGGAGDGMKRTYRPLYRSMEKHPGLEASAGALVDHASG